MAAKSVVQSGLLSAADTFDPPGEPAAGDTLSWGGAFTLTMDKASNVLGAISHLQGGIDFAGYTLACDSYVFSGSTARSTTGAGTLIINGAAATSLDLSGTNGTWGFTGAINLVYAGAAARTYHWGTSRTIPNEVHLAHSTNVNYFQCVTAVTFTGQHTYTSPNALKYTAGATYNYALKPVIVGGSPNVQIIGGSTLNGNLDTAGGGGADVFADWTENYYSTSQIVRDTTDQYEGDSCLRIDYSAATPNYAILERSNAMTIGKRYKASAYVKVSSVAGGPITSLSDQNGGGAFYFAPTTEWAYYSGYFTAVGANFCVSKWKSGSYASKSFYFDQITLQESNEIELFSSTAGSAATLNHSGADGPVFGQSVDIKDINVTGGIWFYNYLSSWHSGTGWIPGPAGHLIGPGSLIGPGILVGRGGLV